MDALHQVVDWPADHVAAAIVFGDGRVETIGDPDRIFRLASLSKPISALAALVAVEEGVVALDDQVDGAPDGVTARHLLAHAAGYPFEGESPQERPGVRRIYSNTGFEVLGRSLTAAIGFPFPTYVHEAVFEPLGMRSSTLDGSPAHAVRSTVGDVARFLTHSLRPWLIDTATAHDARTEQFEGLAGIVPGIGAFDPCPWGLGVELAGDKAPHWTGERRSPATFGHFGGAGTMMWTDPVADVALVALTDLPFDRWAADAVRSWARLSDAVIAESAR